MISNVNLNDSALLIFENIPVGTEVGIDYHSWHVGPRFRGIANIPPGFHFIFFSSVDKYNQKSPRTGFFEYVNNGDVVVKVFDQQDEDLKNVQFTDEEINIYIEGLADIAKYLAPYPSKECKKWNSLCDCISLSLMQRIQPICEKINFCTEVSLQTAGQQKKSIANLDSRLAHKEDPEMLIRFTEIPNSFPVDITPREKTKYSLDSSYYLEKLIRSCSGGENDVIGELQFSFICFLIGQVYDAFDHWKLLVSLLTNCRESLSTRHDFFIKFIEVIDLHMEEIPDDFFVDIVAQNNFLVKIFQSFFQNFSSPDGLNGELLNRVSLLKHKLTSRFDHNFDEEDEDDLPVIVEL